MLRRLGQGHGGGGKEGKGLLQISPISAYEDHILKYQGHLYMPNIGVF